MFARPEERAAIETVAASDGGSFKGVYLTAPLATRIERIEQRKGDVSDANAGVARQQEGVVLGGLNWSLVDASGSLDATFATVRSEI